LSCASGPHEVHLDYGSAVQVLQPKYIFLSARDGAETGDVSVESSDLLSIKRSENATTAINSCISSGIGAKE
jgi:hypothetical protein